MNRTCKPPGKSIYIKYLSASHQKFASALHSDGGEISLYPLDFAQRYRDTVLVT